MAGLQRSAISFRRQGSSGLVWDDKLLASESDQLVSQHKDSKTQPLNTGAVGDSLGPAGLTIERSRSNGGRGGFRAGRVSPAIEPPSPRVSACGCCGAFGGDNKTRRRSPRSGKRVV
ncbi:uncharacterized protein at1g15400 [Phtheirospermum japonicum]|uniref:Uncharacterized protein at1g15400 n=1 Tax=Phtheirospermum japonicum TaxID=374723 RepID=A0A830CI24_9LAMI|nr:uncharacterized protein at1g15400 [Phtheirospermum japonicum]